MGTMYGSQAIASIYLLKLKDIRSTQVPEARNRFEQQYIAIE